MKINNLVKTISSKKELETLLSRHSKVELRKALNISKEDLELIIEHYKNSIINKIESDGGIE